MAEEMLTLPKFEEASEIVKKVTQETKLVYSKYFSEQTGNKVYLKPENMQLCKATSKRKRSKKKNRCGGKGEKGEPKSGLPLVGLKEKVTSPFSPLFRPWK